MRRRSLSRQFQNSTLPSPASAAARITPQKRWLAARPAARTIAELQTQLDTFRDHYNEHRPHRALDRSTPGQAYRATPKALPAEARTPGHYRIRYDRIDDTGKISLRRAGRMHHLGIGRKHAHTRILALADNTTITVIALHTGEVLSTHTINPARSYWTNNTKGPRPETGDPLK